MCGNFLLTESDRILHKKRPFVGSQFVENSPNDSDYGAAEASVSDQDRHSLAAKRKGERIPECPKRYFGFTTIKLRTRKLTSSLLMILSAISCGSSQ